MFLFKSQKQDHSMKEKQISLLGCVIKNNRPTAFIEPLAFFYVILSLSNLQKTLRSFKVT